MSLLVVLLLILLPGLALWLVAGQQMRDNLDPAEAFFLVAMAGVALLSAPAMLLAEFGRFSLTNLTLCALLITGGFTGWAWWRGRAQNPKAGKPLWQGHLLLLPILALAIWLAPRPFPYLVGGRDHGIYVNTGMHIALSGGILINDSELAALSPSQRAVLTNPEVATGPSLVPGPWSEGQRLPGMTIRDGEAGIVVPHGFHLYPVWIAIFSVAGGEEGGLWATPFLALLGSLGIYFVAARLLGKPVALLALLLVALNVGQSWFHSYPTAEILLRTLFWGGLWAVLVMLETRSRTSAALAGLCLGLLHLTKLDTLFVPAVLLPFFLYTAIRGRWRRPYTAFLVAYLAVATHAALHAIAIATIYTLDQATRVLLPSASAAWVIQSVDGANHPGTIIGRLLSSGWSVLTGVIIFVLLVWLLLWRVRERSRSALADAERHSGVLMLLLVVLPLSLLAYAGLVQPIKPVASLATAAETLTLAGWYLSPIGLLLGIVGLVQGYADEVRADTIAARYRLAAWLLLLANSFPLFFLGTGTFPDHFWAARRFVPVLFPALLIGAAGVVGSLFAAAGWRSSRWLLPAVLVVVLVSSEVRAVTPVVHAKDYAGLPEQLRALADKFSVEDVLLFLPGDAANRVSLPLWLLHDRTVFQIKSPALASPELAAQVVIWQEAGRAVYLLYDGGEVPVLAQLAADYQFTQQIAVPQVELSTEALPGQTGYYAAAFSIFRLAPSASSGTLPVVSVQAQLGSDWNPDTHGLYPTGALPGLTPHTWTAETATLSFPAVAGAETLILQIGSGRPEGVPLPTVAVSINGQRLGTVTATDAVALFEWTLPPALAGEQLTVTMETVPWVPAEVGSSADVRPLGVLFYQARVIGT